MRLDCEETAAALGGPVEVLVNSASAFNTDSLHDLTLESWQFLMNVNAAAPVFLMQAFANQDPLPHGGTIVNMLDTQMLSASRRSVSAISAENSPWTEQRGWRHTNSVRSGSA